VKSILIISGMWIVFSIGSCVDSEVDKLPFYNTPELTPEWISKSDSKYSKIHTISDFEYRDQDSLMVTNKTFDSRVYVANYFFTTCPSICPKMTDNMAILQNKFLKTPQVKFLSHSVTPWIDTVEQLKTYALEKGVVSGKWHLVTGSQADIYKHARTAYLIEGQMGLAKGEDDFLHDEKFVLIDAYRRIRGYYSGIVEDDMKRLEEDIRILIEI